MGAETRLHPSSSILAKQAATAGEATAGGPTAHASLARLVLDGLTHAGCDGRALARRAGLPAEGLSGESARVPTERLSGLWRLGLAVTNDPCLGIKVASHWHFGQLRLTDYLFGTAATLAEALEGLERYSAVLNTAANEIRLTGGEGGYMTVTYQIRSGDPDVDLAASQFALASVLFHARHALGREVRPAYLGLMAAAPLRHRDLASHFGVGRIDFGAESCTMTLAPADLACPLPDAAPRLRTVLLEHATSAIAAQAAALTWKGWLREVVAAHLADDGLSLSAAARRLALSPRTLQRRLEEEGTTWREFSDAVRRERTGQLLAQGMNATAVAAHVGFSDARALRGARRRWEGGLGR